MKPTLIDVLRRLQLALPQMRQWIDNLILEHAGAARRVDALGHQRLPNYFAASVLETTYVALVPEIPFPPIVDFGLPEFANMAAIPMAGITFGHMYFVSKAQDSEAIHFHELVHVIQWKALGVDDFLLTYGTGILQNGYKQSPLEALAFTLQATFERGAPIPELQQKVDAHAASALADTAELFRNYGLTVGAPALAADGA